MDDRPKPRPPAAFKTAQLRAALDDVMDDEAAADNSDTSTDGMEADGMEPQAVKQIEVKHSDIFPLSKHTSKRNSDIAIRKMEAMGFDPLVCAVEVAQGGRLTKDHPFLIAFKDTITRWLNLSRDNLAIPAEEVEGFLTLGIRLLTDSWVSPELRTKYILELLNYAYPKKKSVETSHTGSVSHSHELKPIAADEVDSFRKSFEKDF